MGEEGPTFPALQVWPLGALVVVAFLSMSRRVRHWRPPSSTSFSRCAARRPCHRQPEKEEKTKDGGEAHSLAGLVGTSRRRIPRGEAQQRRRPKPPWGPRSPCTTPLPRSGRRSPRSTHRHRCRRWGGEGEVSSTGREGRRTGDGEGRERRHLINREIERAKIENMRG